MGYLGDLSHDLHADGVPAEAGVHGAAEDLVHGSGLMVSCGLHLNPRAVTAVTGVGGHHGTVRGGLAAHHDGSATLSVELLGAEREADGQDSQEGKDAFHSKNSLSKDKEKP